MNKKIKKNNLKQVPMFPTRSWDPNTQMTVDRNILSAASYDGEFMWGDRDPVTGASKRVLPTMVDNIPFTDTLKYSTYYKGRSAAGIVFENKDGRVFNVFMSDFDDMMPFIVRGEITDTFIYCKKGMNYGLQLHRQPIPSENS
jgi:hypothetical protein